jgi:hypothetical protein
MQTGLGVGDGPVVADGVGVIEAVGLFVGVGEASMTVVVSIMFAVWPVDERAVTMVVPTAPIEAPPGIRTKTLKVSVSFAASKKVALLSESLHPGIPLALQDWTGGIDTVKTSVVFPSFVICRT